MLHIRRYYRIESGVLLNYAESIFINVYTHVVHSGVDSDFCLWAGRQGQQQVLL